MKQILNRILAVLAAAALSSGYPSGAPAGACLSLLPRHDAEAQTSVAPYRIQLKARASDVQIDLVGSEPFRGFLINARLASDPQRIVPGMFLPAVDSNVKTLDCISEPASGITHVSSKDTLAIRGVWRAPPGFDDRIIFVGAVVKSFDRFWSNVRSSEVQVRGTGAALLKPQIPDDVYDQCGTTDSCFGLPSNCISTRKCDVVLAYHEEAASHGYFFKMVTTAGTNKYVAAGISHDNLMGDDAVVECVDIGGKLNIRESWNIASDKANELLTSATVEKISQTTQDGVQTCAWTRPYSTILRGTTYDLRHKNYILLAIGNISPNGNKAHHYLAASTATAVDFSVLQIERGDNSQLWVKAHATLMTLAWLFTASLGMMLARHFKNVWEDRMPCGVKMWFACHRLLMVLTLMLSVVGVAIMLYRFGIFKSQAGFHPIVGLVSVALCICQPIMAMFRCHPGTKNRSIFNWAHWFVGNSAQIFGVVAIFLAADLPKSGLRHVHWFIYLIMAFVIFNVVSHLVLQIHGFSVDKRVSTAPDINLQAMGSTGSQITSVQMIETKDSPGSEFRRFTLAIYVVGLIFIVGSLVAVVWLAGTELI